MKMTSVLTGEKYRDC